MLLTTLSYERLGSQINKWCERMAWPKSGQKELNFTARVSDCFCIDFVKIQKFGKKH